MEEENKISAVYIAITTVPAIDKIEVGDETFERFKSTYTEIHQFLKDKDIIQSYQEDAGKSVAFSRILQIAMGFEYNGTVRVSILKGEERYIIEQFHSILRSDFFKDAKLYGYNNEFIRDVLSFRARVNKIGADKEAVQFKDLSLKEWNRKRSVCLMNEVVSSFRGKISMINCCYGAGIDYSGIIPPEDISTYYQAGLIEDIEQSSANYIKCLVNINKFLAADEYLSEITITVKEAEKVEPKKVNLLTHIAETGSLNKDQIKLLAASGEDPDHIVTLVTAALSNNGLNHSDYEPLQDLKDALYGKVDTSQIECVTSKGNMGATEVKKLIKQHADKTKEEKVGILENIRLFLTNNGKITQKRCSAAFEMLEKEWIK